jgi:hypothetical protein
VQILQHRRNISANEGSKKPQKKRLNEEKFLRKVQEEKNKIVITVKLVNFERIVSKYQKLIGYSVRNSESDIRGRNNN